MSWDHHDITMKEDQRMLNTKGWWILSLFLCGPLNAADLYISPTGSDANPGTRQAPFKTLEGARDALRAVACKHDVTVHLLPGRYHRNKPLELGEIDSGPMGQPVVYRADEKGKVVFDRGAQEQLRRASHLL